MRALFTSSPNLGHFLPLTPIARALADAGHDVAFGTPPSLRESAEATGLRWVSAGVDNDDPEMAAVLAFVQARRGEQVAAGQRPNFGVDQIHATVRPRRLLTDLLALAETWRPDVIIRETLEYGAMIAADLLDIPHAKLEIHASGTIPRAIAVLREPLLRLRAAYGNPVRSIDEQLDEYLVLTPFPASLNTVGVPIPPTAHHIRARQQR
jgi:UDP:flavonoid glycosyltransferase YjiC (YdhE family)